jgi:hypothetical protein
VFDPATIDALADTVAAAVLERIGPTLAAASPDAAGWLDSRDAAAYLAISVDALHRRTAARQLDFSQTVPGAPCYFRRADLDAYRMRSIQESVVSWCYKSAPARLEPPGAWPTEVPTP